MTKVLNIKYTKSNGEESHRKIIVVSRPRKNYLVYDLSSLHPDEILILEKALATAEECRENAIADFELLTEKRERDLWRSFKPEGIEWETEDETI